MAKDRVTAKQVAAATEVSQLWLTMEDLMARIRSLERTLEQAELPQQGRRLAALLPCLTCLRADFINVMIDVQRGSDVPERYDLYRLGLVAPPERKEENHAPRRRH